MNKERALLHEVQDCSADPDLSSSRVGALQLPLEEVWRRLELELVQSSGFKNSPLCEEVASYWSACKNGWGRLASSIYNF